MNYTFEIIVRNTQTFLRVIAPSGDTERYYPLADNYDPTEIMSQVRYDK